MLQRYKNKKKKQLAFTLIELLVVIAIIALLASIVLVALNGARAKARMAKRVGDLQQIQTALELYYNNNGSYPVVGGYQGTCALWGSTTPNNTIPGLVSTYIGSFPQDPLVNAVANQNCYIYYSNGTDYKMLDFLLTDITEAQIKSGYASFIDDERQGVSSVCPGAVDGYAVLAVYSSGGVCY